MATTGINAIDNVVENFQLAGITVDDSGNVTAEQGLQLYDENGDITTFGIAAASGLTLSVVTITAVLIQFSPEIAECCETCC